MHYWSSVLDEVLHKHDDEHAFLFTNQGRLGEFYEIADLESAEPLRSSKNRTYFLGDRFPGIYLTKREAETMFWVIQDHTLAYAAHQMKLSSRTVEFYVKNLRLKLQCKTKKELVEKILQSDLLKQLENDGYKIAWH